MQIDGAIMTLGNENNSTGSCMGNINAKGLNLKMSYQIASLFHMYIDMGERIAGKQDRFSLIIEDPLRAAKIPPK